MVAVLVSGGCSGDDGRPVAEPGLVVFRSACAATSEVVFPEVAIAQRRSMIVHVVNAGDSAVTLGDRGSEIRISGPDAAAFEIVPADFNVERSQYDCTLEGEFLPPGAWCQLVIAFHPDDVGPRQATVEIGGAGSLPVSGTAAPVPAAVTTDLANLAFAYIPTGLPSSVLLRNDGPTAVVLGDPVVDPPFVFRGWDCPASLTPGGACRARVEVDLRTRIEVCTSGEFSTTTSSLRTPLSYTPAQPFTVSLIVYPAGAGTGRVTSADGTIDCAGYNEPGCVATYFVPPMSVDVTAEVEPGSEFVGWVDRDTSTFLPCGAASCPIALPPASTLAPISHGVIAWISPSENKRISVTVVGTGTVEAPGLVYCSSSCSYTVAPNSTQTLRATTAGTFVGWSGDCSGTADCALGTVVNDRNVTATFSP